MEFRILGELEVRAGGGALDLGGLRQRRVLAALLLSPNRVVPLWRLVASVWDDEPPPTAERLVRNRVAGLRSVLTRKGGFIDTDGDGYRLRVGPGELDAAVFEELAARGRAAGDARLLRDALALWRGPALAGLGGEALGRDAARLEEQRLAVVEECLELELAAGGPDRLVDELAALVAAHPFRERLVGLWMTALYRCGRRAEALAAYRALADRLLDDLGIDPVPELRRLREGVLRQEPVLSLLAERQTEPAVAPAQLPRDVPRFTGRVGDLAQLDALLSDGQAGPAVVISAIAGTAGVGKTALAVHWAHRVRDKFPDGQLYVNLRGFDPTGSVKAPADALRGFLDALRIPARRVPADLEGRAELYRGLLAGKRMLVVLDNAGDAEQVRPLLPAAPDCLVLITSRNRLPGLADDGAHQVILDVLSPAEARQLLASRLGADRVAADPDAVDEIIDRCARLPLALAIVAAAHDQVPLAALADELRRAHGTLGPFTGDDPRTDVRAVFSWSYRALSPAAARLFRLLGRHPGPDLTAPAAASLAGLPDAETHHLLAELTRANLITEHRPGRYTLHDLLRAYAGELTVAVDAEADRRTALYRALDHYLHTAYRGVMLLDPQRQPIDLTPARPGVTPEHITDHRQALAWFTAEHAVLMAAVATAAASGFDEQTWQLAWTLGTFLDRQGHWHDLASTGHAALAATRRLGDRHGQARAHRGLAAAEDQLGREDTAIQHYREALDLYRELGDAGAQADTYFGLGLVAATHGRYRDALGYAEQALDLYRVTGNRTGLARILNATGWTHAQLGDYDHALLRCEEALALLQQLGDRRGQADTWESLGGIHQGLGHHREAAACYQRAVDLFQEVGDRHFTARTLVRLGDVHHAAGEPGAARDQWERALRIFEKLSQPDADAVRAKLAAS
jgi:DNA-binding SARP family transcriptional activator/tetratricopeptide (TPR) repeat protein